jgi:ADP-heptose:LPS heptosyltransferase
VGLATRGGVAVFRGRAAARGAGAPALFPLFTHRVVVRSERGDRTTHWTQILLDFARALGCDTADATPRFVVDDASRTRVRALLASAGVAEPYVVLHPTRGISAARERWPVARLGELARALRAEQRATVVVTGSPADRAVSDAIASAGGAVPLGGRTTLPDFAALAEASRAVVAMDSGPMHIAAAVGAPTVGIFALQSDEPRRWAPLGKRTAVVTATYPCPPSHRKETCPNFACVAELDIPAVLASLATLLA